MRGDNTGVVAVADGERPLQDRLHVGGKGGVRVIGGDQSTPAKKMGETGLMSRSREAPVTRSANQLRHRIASNKRRVRASCFLMLEGWMMLARWPTRSCPSTPSCQSIARGVALGSCTSKRTN
jgi:hypothetical protein